MLNISKLVEIYLLFTKQLGYIGTHKDGFITTNRCTRWLKLQNIKMMILFNNIITKAINIFYTYCGSFQGYSNLCSSLLSSQDSNFNSFVHVQVQRNDQKIKPCTRRAKTGTSRTSTESTLLSLSVNSRLSLELFWINSRDRSSRLNERVCYQAVSTWRNKIQIRFRTSVFIYYCYNISTLD